MAEPRRIESTGLVFYADRQTRLGLAIIRHVPAAWRLTTSGSPGEAW